MFRPRKATLVATAFDVQLYAGRTPRSFAVAQDLSLWQFR